MHFNNYFHNKMKKIMNINKNFNLFNDLIVLVM